MKYIFIGLFICNLTFGQDYGDYPKHLTYSTSYGGSYNSKKINKKINDQYLVTPDSGVEYYSSGNIHAAGGLMEFRKYSTNYREDSESKKLVTYILNGHWTVYFDSDSQIIRSKGYYQNGLREGLWYFYNQQDTNLRQIIEYSQGLEKSAQIFSKQALADNDVFISDFKSFFNENINFFTLISILPILLFRIISNINTYNEIYKKEYIPGVHKWQKGGVLVNFYTTVIFWWIVYPTDNLAIKKSKKLSNVVSIVSIIIFTTFLLLFKIYGQIN